MTQSEEDKALQELCQALANCSDEDLLWDFLHSILTENEISEVASRWALVDLIDQGVPQRKISADLGLSLCKITRGSKELKKENSPFKAMIHLKKESTPSE